MKPGAFASGKRALGICDGCGLTYLLKDLDWEYERRKRTGFLKCSGCNDPDHPQNFAGENVMADAEALRDPRPDTVKQ